MLNQKAKQRLLILVGLISAMGLISLYTLSAMTNQDQLQSRRASELEQTPLPTVEYRAKEPSNVGESSIRRARSARHNQSPMNVRELPPDVDQLPIITHFWWGLSAIPTEQSDAIIVGEVTAAQAHLSNDKTGVYSEFNLHVEQILKAPEGLSPTSIVVERPGGAVRFESGRTVRYEIQNQGMPRVGRRYLLFLKYMNDGDDFSVLTGYALRNGSVAPLDSVEGIFGQYQNLSEDAFNKLVITTIKREATKQ